MENELTFNGSKPRHTRFEKARIVGARALQISLGAPALIETKNEIDSVQIALKEYEMDLIPMSIAE